jgi:hypothetical protein
VPVRVHAAHHNPFPNRPVQIRFEKCVGSATIFYATVALSFVIPSEAEGPAVPPISPGKAKYVAQRELSPRLNRNTQRQRHSWMSLGHGHDNPMSETLLQDWNMAHRSEERCVIFHVPRLPLAIVR